MEKVNIFLLVLLLLISCLDVEGQVCRPSGRIVGRKPPPGRCNQENDSDCCAQGQTYTTYRCSPTVTSHTNAKLTLNSFEDGGDGGGPSECDGKYHSDDLPVVALSTGWYSRGNRCFHNITISGNGRTVKAMVVDECDSTMGCDDEHDYQPPCANNIVDASKAVWKALGIPQDNWGDLDITWSEMKNQVVSSVSLFILLLLLLSISSSVEAKACKPSGKIKGKKPPPGKCNTENDSECCVPDKLYDTYKCSPHVTRRTKAVLTLNSFEKGGDGGAPSECDNKYHSDNIPVVALSTGCFSRCRRCLQNITIHGNGQSVDAMVVDECDSTKGCDEEHDYQPPCPNNIVDASKAVWKALKVPKSKWGEMDVFWSDV
ncbi:hypothetical protein NMG60_11022891 [Bertholletia excelsa]